MYKDDVIRRDTDIGGRLTNESDRPRLSTWEDTILTVLEGVKRLSYSQVDRITNKLAAEDSARFVYVNAVANAYYLKEERRVTIHDDEQYIAYDFPNTVPYDVAIDLGISCALDSVSDTSSEIRTITKGSLGDIEYISNGKLFVTKYLNVQYPAAAKSTELKCAKDAAAMHKFLPGISGADYLPRPIFIVSDNEYTDAILNRFSDPKLKVSIPYSVAIAKRNVNDGSCTFEYLVDKDNEAAFYESIKDNE